MTKKPQVKTQVPRLLMVGILLFLVLLLASCNILKGGTSPQAYPVRVGTDGLHMAFTSNTPPASVFASLPEFESVFPVVIELNNLGATDITNGFLTLGLENDYMELASWELEELPLEAVGASGKTLSFTLQGKSAYAPQGQRELLPFTIRAKELDQQSLHHTSTISLTACYEYETKASTPVCIDPDIYNLKPVEKVCTIEPQQLRGGQGGPVAIVKIETKMIPKDNSIVPQFILYFENRGNGLVVHKQNIDKACTSLGLKPQEWAKLHLDDISFSDFSLQQGQFTCSSDVVPLKEKKGFMRCTLQPGLLDTSIDAYETPLIVSFSYGYTFSISKDVVLERIEQ